MSGQPVETVITPRSPQDPASRGMPVADSTHSAAVKPTGPSDDYARTPSEALKR